MPEAVASNVINAATAALLKPPIGDDRIDYLRPGMTVHNGQPMT